MKILQKFISLKTRWKVVFLLFIMLVVIAVYLVMPPIVELSSNTKYDIQEATIRYIFQKKYENSKKDVVCFIGIGDNFDPNRSDSFPPLDTPQDFYNRFSNLNVPVLKISDIAKGNNFAGGLIDSNKRTGAIIAAGSVDQKTQFIVRCKGLFFAGGLCSEGYDIYLLRTPMGWFVIKVKTLWVS